MVGSPTSGKDASIFEILGQLFCGDPKAGLAHTEDGVFPPKEVRVRPGEGFAKRGVAVAALRGRNSEASPLPAPNPDSSSADELRSGDSQSEPASAVTRRQNLDELRSGEPQSATATAAVSRRLNLPAIDVPGPALDVHEPPPPPTNASTAKQEQENPAVSRESRSRSRSPQVARTASAESGASPGAERRASGGGFMSPNPQNPKPSATIPRLQV